MVSVLDFYIIIFQEVLRIWAAYSRVLWDPIKSRRAGSDTGTRRLAV